MLIVSDFHDFYDTCMKLGMDKTIVYQRKTVYVEGKSFPRLVSRGWNAAVLAVCGKYYPFVYHVDVGCTIDRIIWNVDEALAAISFSRYSWDKERIDTEQGLKTFFSRTWPAMDRIFYDYKTPIFGFEPILGRQYSWMKKKDFNALVINPCLKAIEFYKVRDPFSLFQDIQGYISGVIGIDTKPIVEISDNVKAAAKGHDGPYSFRKPPGKRGKNRWR